MSAKRQILTVFFKTNRSLIVATFGFGLMASGLTLLLPISLGKFFELEFGGNKKAVLLQWFPDSWGADLNAFLLVFVAMVALRTIFHFAQRYGAGLLGERFAKQIREQLFEHQLRITTAVYDEKGVGQFLLRYSADMQSVQNYLTAGILQFGIDCLMILLALLAMAWLSPMVSLTMAAGFLLTAILVYLLNERLSKATSKRRGSRSELLAFVSERLLAAVTLKAFNKEAPEYQKFVKQSDELYSYGANFHRIYSLIYALIPGLIYAVLGVVLFTVHRMKGTGLDSTSLLAFVLLFITLIPTLRRAYRANSVWEMGNVSFRKLSKLLSLDAEKKELPPFRFKRGKIELNNLGFGFSKKTKLLSQLNLTLRAGRLTVLAAPPSYGKTTLLKLLMGIYHPTEGQILVDGQNLSMVDLKTWRRNAVAISDGFPLLGRTVFEAISYSRKPEKREKAAQILAVLQEGLPEGQQLDLDKKIGERGIKLSAGQRKLLQYGRAFLTEKPILFIDDPMTDLPAEARMNIVRMLMERTKDRTIVLLVSEWNDGWLHADEVVQLAENDLPKSLFKNKK
ncbi:MAG: ABC transporter ATP-binding protein [Saprospiraceae bacterium]|nr:ABC transporter ATP-binding protein [Saprospiraceae bacterium]